MDIRFDGTFRIADIVSIVIFLGVGLGAYYNIKAILKLFGYRLDVIDASIEDLQKETKNGNVQDAEIARLRADTSLLHQMVFDLQRGRGYVEKEINGEYTRQGKIK